MRKFGPISNTFFRLAQKDERGGYTICDFHKNSGAMWIQKHEGVTLNEIGERYGDCAHHPMRRVHSAEYGNKIYREYKEMGFKFVGRFEQDIFGVERKLV